MKILRIFLILLIPAMGIVGCKKSALTGKHCSEQPENVSNGTADKPEASTPEVSGRFAGAGIEGEGGEGEFESGGEDDGPANIVGSGDDDRDGGEKKKKR